VAFGLKNSPQRVQGTSIRRRRSTLRVEWLLASTPEEHYYEQHRSMFGPASTFPAMVELLKKGVVGNSARHVARHLTLSEQEGDWE
jgi:hypothetical protein